MNQDKTSTNESIDDAEKALRSAVDSKDMEAIAQARLKLNDLRLQQFRQQAALLKEQQEQQKMEQEQAEKEHVIAIYKEYLETGSLSDEKLRQLVSFDKKQTDFDKVAIRLEAIEQLKLEHPRASFNTYQTLLESVHTNYDSIDDLLDAEYYQISSKNSVKDKQMDSDNSLENVME